MTKKLNTEQPNSLSLDQTDCWRIRIVDARGSYDYHWLGHVDFFTAELIADEYRHNRYLPLDSTSSVIVEIDCPLHGWTPAPWGFCDECGDDAVEACLDALYGELNEEDEEPSEYEVAESWLQLGLLDEDDLAAIDDLPW